MRSTDEETAPQAAEDFTVLVTGYGPFNAGYPVNPSWAIASSLPPYLPLVGAKSSTTGAINDAPMTDPALVTLPAVRILVHPEPVRVSYGVVRELVPKLWEQPRRIDLAIHIGMAVPRLYYSVERRAHRDGYTVPDVDNKCLGDEERRKREGKDWVWHGLPDEILTDVNLDDVLRRWRRHSPEGSDLRISEDAGRYLCDFIYFSSLAHLTKAGERKRVVFFHVPADASDWSVTRGRDLTLHLIRSLAESELAKK